MAGRFQLFSSTLPERRPLYAALYLPTLTGEGEFAESVARARAGGASGVALFGGVREIPRG